MEKTQKVKPKSQLASENPITEIVIIQEYVTLHVVASDLCSPTIKEGMELCVGGITPRAMEAAYTAKMVGIYEEDVYKFSQEYILPDPVKIFSPNTSAKLKNCPLKDFRWPKNVLY